MAQTGPTPTERREKRLAISFGNPAFFGETYVRPFDDGWDGPLPLLPIEMLRFAMRTRRGVVMTPPEFLKTTTLSQLYPLWLTYRYALAGKLSLLAGALMSELQELAERNLRVVAWHIENNDLLASDFVDVHGRPLVEPDEEEDKWTDDEIIVRRAGVSKDPTWQAKGIYTTIQGARLNHLIGDDLVTPGSAKSVAKQTDAKQRWDDEVTTRLKHGGQAIVAGNFNHSKDLLSTIASRASYALLRRPALHVAGDPSTPPDDPRDPDAVEALPGKWPRSRLMGELSDKPASFSRVYLLRPGQKGGALLRSAWVTRLGGWEEIPMLSRVYLFAVDPAPGAEVDPDPSFFTITVGVMTPTHLDVVESFAARMEPTEQVELLGEKVASYEGREEDAHVGGIGISKVSLDRYAQGAYMAGNPWLRPLLHAHSVPGDKTERLAHLGPFFKNGWARVLQSAWTEKTSAPDDREQETTLEEEWTTLGAQRHDDRLDGLDVLVREARARGGMPGGAQKTVIGGGEQVDGRQLERPLTEGIMTRTW